MMPYNIQGSYARQEESSEKRNTALNAVYAPPRLQINIEGSEHQVTIPEGVLGEYEQNRINIGENTQIDESTDEKSTFSKKMDTMTVLVILLVLMLMSGLAKRIIALIVPQLQILMHHYKKD